MRDGYGFNEGEMSSSPFKAMNSAHLLMCQKDVRPTVQKRFRTMAFSRISPGDSVIPSFCEMKNEPALKALHVNILYSCFSF